VPRSETADLELRARRHAALGDPVRLAIADELVRSDRAPVELGERLALESNLLAHHLDVLEAAGLIGRSKSSGDGRRRYVHLLTGALDLLGPVTPPRPQRVLFVCTANSARSQLAAALWTQRTGDRATSAGTHPGPTVHPGAVAAARRAGLDLGGATPRLLRPGDTRGALVVTVCDRAHEELGDPPARLHWSVPDPVPVASRAAFDAVVAELAERIDRWAGTGRAA
jgi:ArsR family transcriptional regulator, arsenate/arsenite/antimonite-responsive transcriptional repressor / arsenate reductase (thioredoxin)